MLMEKQGNLSDRSACGSVLEFPVHLGPGIWTSCEAMHLDAGPERSRETPVFKGPFRLLMRYSSLRGVEKMGKMPTGWCEWGERKSKSTLGSSKKGHKLGKPS